MAKLELPKMSGPQQVATSGSRVSLHVALHYFVRNPWRDRLLKPDFLTDFEPPATRPFISELYFFVDHIIEEYDYNDIELNVGRVFWTLEESQLVGKLARIVLSVLKRMPPNTDTDAIIFLNSAEWPEIERLAHEALDLLEAEDARRDPDSPIIFEQKLKELDDLRQKYLHDI